MNYSAFIFVLKCCNCVYFGSRGLTLGEVSEVKSSRAVCPAVYHGSVSLLVVVLYHGKGEIRESCRFYKIQPCLLEQSLLKHLAATGIQLFGSCVPSTLYRFGWMGQKRGSETDGAVPEQLTWHEITLPLLAALVCPAGLYILKQVIGLHRIHRMPQEKEHYFCGPLLFKAAVNPKKYAVPFFPLSNL